MKIISATIYQVASQGLKPIIVKLETSEGIVGLGEVAVAYGCGGTAAAGMIKDLCERFVVGVGEIGINSVVSEMYDQSFWLRNPGGIAASGLSAIEMALWDIRARELGVPVYELFGGKMRDKLRYYANGWYFGATNVSEFLKLAERAVKDGHKALKMYPLARIQSNGTLRHASNRYADDGQAVADGVNLVRQVRNAVGEDVELMLDLAAGMTIGDTISFCKQIEDFDIAFIEEANDPGDLGMLRQLARNTKIPIATGERHFMRYGFRDLLESRTVSILQPDIGNTGGFAEAYKITSMAEAYSLKVQPHICGSSVAAQIAACFSATIPNFYIQEHFPYWNDIPGFIEVAEVPFESSATDGYIAVPKEPGFGVSLNEKVLADHIWARVVAG